jgi:16S rRNA (cytosine967-C5)-methyltransferase
MTKSKNVLRRPTAAKGAGVRSAAGLKGAAATAKPASKSGAKSAGGQRDPGAVETSVLEAAIEALEQALGLVYPADSVLSHFFRENKTGLRDRAFIAELVYAVLRRKRSLEKSANSHPSHASLARKLALLALIRYRGISVRQLETTIKKRDYDWLTEAAGYRVQDDASLTDAERLDIPDWLCERLAAQRSAQDMTALMHALNSPAPLDVRVNTLKDDRDKVLAKLTEKGIEASACVYSPVGIRLRHKQSLNTSPLFTYGVIEVQDEGSQLLSLLLAPRRGEMVVDFCAGAGGKTLHIGAMMRSTGRLYAFDVSEKRLANLKPRMARAELSNVYPIVISSENDQRVRRLAGKIDRVLVDAPCSGLGTLRRNPDLKWRQTTTAVDELVVKQAAILASASRMLKPGGRLVYATCSILREENEDIVNAFLATHPEFALVPAQQALTEARVEMACDTDMLNIAPHIHGCDGFFAAVLERSKVIAVTATAAEDVSE